LQNFYEEVAEIYVVVACSLSETLINPQIPFSAEHVEYLALHPCCFCEFLVAMDETKIEKAVKHHSITEALHAKTMTLFNTFASTGGMPEVVAHFCQHRDFVSLYEIYDVMLTSYCDDVKQYARSDIMSHVINHILAEGWDYTSQRITLGNFASSSYKAREVGEAFHTLEKTMLLELVYPVTSTFTPATIDTRRSPKLIWNDVGLVNYVAKIQDNVSGLEDILDAYRGQIAQQVVAQELRAHESLLSAQRSFWVREKKGSNVEVDFIVQYDNKIIPIEVTEHNTKLRSLFWFMEEAPHNIAVRIWTHPLSIEEVFTQKGKKFKLINIPFYYVGQLKEILKQYV
jgi:predicted AAA+ superfamily ATPase